MDGVFQSELQWLEPYYELVRHMLKRHKLESVYYMPLQHNTVVRAYGKCSRYEGEYYRYYIGLRTEYWHIQKLSPLVRKRKPLSTLDILHTFAHELAHIQHWDHTPEHKLLECKIMTRFMRQAKKDGYISEEDELA